MTAHEALRRAKQRLSGATDRPLREAELLLAAALKTSPLKALSRKKLSQREWRRFLLKIQRRRDGAPLDYIIGEKQFFNRKFYIKPSVFIPRGESETLLKPALEARPLRGLDLGAGSGCLCASLLLEAPKLRFCAVEKSPAALSALKKNRRLHGLVKRLKILNKDVLRLRKSDLRSFLKGPPDLIIANPPYIAPLDPAAHRETRLFEPPLALFSPEGGMAHIRSWFEKAMSLLDPKGLYIFEFGFNQSLQVKKFLSGRNVRFRFYKDGSGFDRAAACAPARALDRF